jgi:methylmalonyl-CoA/ethylmalonyl-CoA epimerase
MSASAPRSSEGDGGEGRSWTILGIHHVAFAHGGDGPTGPLATVLGLTCERGEVAEGFIEEMIPVGGSALQMLTATGPGTVATFIERRGAGLHHVALRVDDIDAITSDLCSRGIQMIDREPRLGGLGTRIAFAHPRAFGGMLVEFVEDRQ